LSRFREFVAPRRKNVTIRISRTISTWADKDNPSGWAIRWKFGVMPANSRVAAAAT